LREELGDVLAALALSPNRIVSIDELVELVLQRRRQSGGLRDVLGPEECSARWSAGVTVGSRTGPTGVTIGRFG
jgi:hypothetical protein